MLLKNILGPREARGVDCRPSMAHMWPQEAPSKIVVLKILETPDLMAFRFETDFHNHNSGICRYGLSHLFSYCKFYFS